MLWAGFFIATYHLTRESLWYDEGWTMWAVHDQGRIQESPLQIAQYIKTNLTDTLGRVRGDVHPPLYFLLLDVWVMLVGETVYAVRLLSALCGIVALSATYALGTRLFDHKTGWMAVILLGTASFFVYYTREARMYALLVALSALSTWAYVVWRQRPTTLRAFSYGLSMALLLYTHYAGVLVIAAHLLHWLLVGMTHILRRRGIQFNRSMLLRAIRPYLLTLILFAAWIPVLVSQFRANNGRPLAEALPPEWATVAPLLLIITSGYWWMYLLPLTVSIGLRLLSRTAPKTQTSEFSALSLLLLWGILTPLVLLALNIWVTPVFQIRYNIAILPAAALLVAYGFRWFTYSKFSTASIRKGLRPSPTRAIFSPSLFWRGDQGVRSAWVVLAVQRFLLLWLAYTQLAMYTEFWPDKPRWNEAVSQMTAARQPLEPALTDFNDSSVAAYYDRIYGIRRGISIDLSWRDHTPDETRAIVAKLDNAPSVWAVMRSDVPSTWDAVASLTGTRGIGYRDSVMNVIFYRFDAGKNDSFDFHFGDRVRYDAGIGHQFYAQVGQRFCLPVELTFTALQSLDGTIFAGLSLTQGYNLLRVRWDDTLGTHDMGAAIALSPCLNIPDDTPRGPHHLRLVVYREHDANRLPLIEGGAANLYWGTELMLATVSVDD